jgi:hypothetical protein
MIIKYKYGLFHKEKLYGFDENWKLYRLPQMIGKNFYGLLKCKPWKDGFFLGADRKSKSQLEAMTIVIDKEISVVKDKDVPF